MSTKRTHSRGRIPLPVQLTLPLALGMLAGNSSTAATLAVTNCDDAGNGSLRDAIAAAHSDDVIDLTHLTCSSISLTTGELVVDVPDLILRGPGADKLTIVGGPQHYVIDHLAGGLLTVDSLRITDPNVQTGGACLHSSSGIYLNASKIDHCAGSGVNAGYLIALHSSISNNYQGINVTGSVLIQNSTIAENHGVTCSGLWIGRIDNVIPVYSYYSPSAAIRNSTISGNFAFYYDNGAGCIFVPATISNSTIANNGSNNITPGLLIASATTIESSILAKNNGSRDSNDLFVMGNAQVTGHNNLIMTTSNGMVPADTIRADPQLLALADNGGMTLTHALAATSPAIDAGNNSAGLATDQRGAPFVRVAGGRADIGAFELQATPPGIVSIGPGFTGSWYDPNQSGQGLSLEVLSNNRFYATWFSFDPIGGQAWFTGVGLYSGNTATVTQMVQPEGARWIPNFRHSDVVVVPWGSLTFTFSDCDHGRVDFASGVTGFGEGHMDLTRLTQPAGLACP